MPYVHGYTVEAIHQNVSTFCREGYPQPQAVAMALEVARRAWRKANPKGAYPVHLKGVRAPRKKRSHAARRRALARSYGLGMR